MRNWLHAAAWSTTVWLISSAPRCEDCILLACTRHGVDAARRVFDRSLWPEAPSIGWRHACWHPDVVGLVGYMSSYRDLLNPSLYLLGVVDRWPVLCRIDQWSVYLRDIALAYSNKRLITRLANTKSRPVTQSVLMYVFSILLLGCVFLQPATHQSASRLVVRDLCILIHLPYSFPIMFDCFYACNWFWNIRTPSVCKGRVCYQGNTHGYMYT